jgi:hypothetical protein
MGYCDPLIRRFVPSCVAFDVAPIGSAVSFAGRVCSPCQANMLLFWVFEALNTTARHLMRVLPKYARQCTVRVWLWVQCSYGCCCRSDTMPRAGFCHTSKTIALTSLMQFLPSSL